MGNFIKAFKQKMAANRASAPTASSEGGGTGSIFGVLQKLQSNAPTMQAVDQGGVLKKFGDMARKMAADHAAATPAPVDTAQMQPVDEDTEARRKAGAAFDNGGVSIRVV